MQIKRLLTGVLASVAIMVLSGIGTTATAKTKLTIWSNFADQESSRAVIEDVRMQFEKENPDVEVDVSYFEKAALFAAQMTALRAGSGPDIIYLEPDRWQFIDAGYVRPLNGLIDEDQLQDYARESWTKDGKLYAFTLSALTVELYYNKKIMADLGITVPNDATFTQGEFLAAVEKAGAAGITPIVQGVGDRPFPGSYLTHELLLRMLGKDDYGKLWAGELSFKDPRVVEVFTYMKQLIDSGAYPKTFTTLKLGESHSYFYNKPGGLFFPMGSWYTARAFNSPEKGGQREDFSLGVMQFPKMDNGACPTCKTMSAGGSYAITTASQVPEIAAKFLDVMGREETGRKWLSTVYLATGIKVDPSYDIGGKYGDYFKRIAELGSDRQWFIGTPIDHIGGQCKETFVQVVNSAFPAGLIDVEQSLDMMETACRKAQ